MESRWILVISLLLTTFANAAEWSLDPTVQRWWNESVVRACCSLADGFEADEYESTEGGVWATITDDGSPVCWEDDDGTQLCRRALPEQKKFFVPQEKIRYDPKNPTGHGILFLLTNDQVMCYFLPSGA